MSTDDLTKQLPSDNLLRDILARLTSIETGQNQMSVELTELKNKVDARLHDTRPMWEGVIAKLDALSRDVGNVNRKLDVLHGDVLQVRADQKQVNDRMDSLEKQPV